MLLENKSSRWAKGALGTWHLNANGHPLTLHVEGRGGSGGYVGNVLDDHGVQSRVSSITFRDSTGGLSFCRIAEDVCEWYQGQVVEGVFMGRFSRDQARSETPPEPRSYRWHVSGWNSDYLDAEIVPRVFDVVFSAERRATLRVDRSSDGVLIGRFKTYAAMSAVGWSADGEELEYDLEELRWDGVNISFSLKGQECSEAYSGVVSGRTVAGTFATTIGTRQQDHSWRGERANLLTYGLAPKSHDEHQEWQRRTRRQIEHLIMGESAMTQSTVRFVSAELPPLPDGPVGPSRGYDRDDDPGRWPRRYSRREWIAEFTLADPYSGGTMTRRAHGWLALPTPRQGERLRGVVAVNGHPDPNVFNRSSAWCLLDPTDADYWYGEAFARRGYVVVAVDISHRPLEDRQALYSDFTMGNDPLHGNGPHPAIQSSEHVHDSDWEEDGERAWTTSRVLDLLLTGKFGVEVDASRVLIAGLSLGGEVATFAGARFSLLHRDLRRLFAGSQRS